MGQSTPAGTSCRLAPGTESRSSTQDRATSIERQPARACGTACRHRLWRLWRDMMPKREMILLSMTRALGWVAGAVLLTGTLLYLDLELNMFCWREQGHQRSVKSEDSTLRHMWHRDGCRAGQHGDRQRVLPVLGGEIRTQNRCRGMMRAQRSPWGAGEIGTGVDRLPMARC